MVYECGASWPSARTGELLTRADCLCPRSSLHGCRATYSSDDVAPVGMPCLVHSALPRACLQLPPPMRGQYPHPLPHPVLARLHVVLAAVQADVGTAGAGAGRAIQLPQAASLNPLQYIQGLARVITGGS